MDLNYLTQWFLKNWSRKLYATDKYKKMWYEWVPMIQLSIQVTILKVNHYSSKYSLQHWALAHTEQQIMTSVKPFKLEKQLSNLYKKNVKHLWTQWTNDNHITSGSWLSTGANKSCGFKHFNRHQPSPYPETIV